MCLPVRHTLKFLSTTLIMMIGRCWTLPLPRPKRLELLREEKGDALLSLLPFCFCGFVLASSPLVPFLFFYFRDSSCKLSIGIARVCPGGSALASLIASFSTGGRRKPN